MFRHGQRALSRDPDVGAESMGDYPRVAAYEPTMVVPTWARPALRTERPGRYCPPRCEMGRGRAAESSIDDKEARGLLVRMARLDRKGER
jgi:hypothetical protein